MHWPVDVGQDQGVQLSIGNRDGGISVGVLLRHHGLAKRPDRLGAPAATAIRDAPETRFVLKH
jgi:hypothetical protein